jgi:hypothetical protein
MKSRIHQVKAKLFLLRRAISVEQIIDAVAGAVVGILLVSLLEGGRSKESRKVGHTTSAGPGSTVELAWRETDPISSRLGRERR